MRNYFKKTSKSTISPRLKLACKDIRKLKVFDCHFKYAHPLPPSPPPN